jgi:hypothetical protein
MLYIYGGSEDYNINIKETDYVYHVNTGCVTSKAKCLDDLKKVHDIALVIRDDYVEYINSLNELFVNNKLIYDRSISLFYLSDLFNKRTEMFDTYISICHITYINERLIKNFQINYIKTIECSSSFNNALASVIQGIELERINENSNKINFLRNHIIQYKYFIVSVFKLVMLKILYNEKSLTKTDSLFLTRYPLHFNKNFVDEKYGDLVKKNDVYLISVLTDGMHQNIHFRDIAKHARALSKRHNVILLDSYLKIIDFVGGLFGYLLLSNQSKILYRQNYVFNNINITGFIKHELNQSINRIPRIFCYQSAIKKVLSRFKISRFTFYLHEYSYGRYFNYILAKYFPNIERVGFQHGPAARRKLLYYLGKNVVSNSSNQWLHKTPIPNNVLAEDSLSKEVYEEAGYNNVWILEKVYRLDYLKKIKRDKIVENLVLIVPGLHDGLSLLDKVRSYIINNPEKKFILKPHPRSGHFRNGIPEKYNYVNMSVGDEHISEYLAKVSEVIATYSSVGSEAYLLGIRTYLVCLPNKINESPLLDLYERKPDSLINIIW